MSNVVYDIARTFFVRADRDSDLVSFLGEFAKKNGITVGAFTAIGALKSARLSFYDQTKREHVEIAALDGPQELISCMGNIVLRDGQLYTHAHVVLVDEQGNTRAGHLLEGIVFFTQVCLHELQGPRA